MTSESVDEVQTVLSVVRELEDRFDLFAWQWEGVPFWSAFRPLIVEKLLGLVAGVGPAQQVKASQFNSRLRSASTNLTTRNPWLKRLRGRYLVARWERSQIIGNRACEPLSDAIGAALPDDVIFLDMTGKRHGSSARTWSVEAINLAARAYLSRPGARNEAFPLFAAVEAALQDQLGVAIDLQELLGERVLDVAIRRRLYRRLLAGAGVEEVFAVVAYANPSLVLGAKDLGIPVTDIQHGLLNFAYDGLGRRRDSCVPDKLALFGDQWLRSIEDPSNIVYSVVGAPHIRERIDRMSIMPREPFLLVLSQPMIRKQLLAFALRAASLPNAPSIIYRLHPGDNQQECEQMVAAYSTTTKLTLSVGGGAEATLTLQARAWGQLGAFSTAMLEGLALGTPTFIVPVTGFSMIMPYLDGTTSSVVNSEEDLVSRYHNAKPETPSAELVEPFFAKFNAVAINTLIRK